LLPQLRPISAFPGYNPNATYLDAPSALPEAYPAAPPRQRQEVAMPRLPPISALSNQPTSGGSDPANGTGFQPGQGYGGVVSAIASGLPGDVWQDASFLDLGSMGYGAGFNGRSTDPFGSYGNGGYGGFGGFSSLFGQQSGLPDHPAPGLPPLPSQTSDHGLDTPFGRVTRSDLLNGALQVGLGMIPGAGMLNTAINFGSGVATGLDKARYGDTNSVYAYGDGQGTQAVPNEGQSVLSKLLHSTTTLGDWTGQEFGSLLGLGQGPIDANPSAAASMKDWQRDAILMNGGDPNSFFDPNEAMKDYNRNYDSYMANMQTRMANQAYSLSPQDQNQLAHSMDNYDLGGGYVPSLVALGSDSYNLAASWGGPGYGYGDAQPYNNAQGSYDERRANGGFRTAPQGNETT
jgi:hypothetical protein